MARCTTRAIKSSTIQQVCKLTLPLLSVVKDYKVGKVRALMTLEESQDQTISVPEPEIRTGKKWSAKEA
jgi:hypothetical protein